MTYVYRRTEPGLWTVGYYDPKGKWEPESDHDSQEAAAERVHWMNGGRSDLPRAAAMHQLIKAMVDEWDEDPSNNVSAVEWHAYVEERVSEFRHLLANDR